MTWKSDKYKRGWHGGNLVDWGFCGQCELKGVKKNVYLPKKGLAL